MFETKFCERSEFSTVTFLFFLTTPNRRSIEPFPAAARDVDRPFLVMLTGHVLLPYDTIVDFQLGAMMIRR